MTDHACGDCLRWPECNGVAWGTPDCPGSPTPPRIWVEDDKTVSGLIEED